MSWSAGSGRGGTVCPPAGFPPDPCRTVGAVINRPGDSAGVPAGQCAPHSLFGCAKKRTRRARCKRKRRRARSGAVALRAYGGRRTRACSDCSGHSGTLGPSVRSILPSRGGWCGSCRDARTHLNCFAFPVSRYGAPGISVISVSLVPPSARSASLRAALAVMEAAAWPYAETLINHRPAAAKISAACIPDFPGLEGFTRAGRFPL